MFPFLWKTHPITSQVFRHMHFIIVTQKFKKKKRFFHGCYSMVPVRAPNYGIQYKPPAICAWSQVLISNLHYQQYFGNLYLWSESITLPVPKVFLERFVFGLQSGVHFGTGVAREINRFQKFAP